MSEQALVFQKKAAKGISLGASASVFASPDDAVSLYAKLTRALWILIDSTDLVSLPSVRTTSGGKRRVLVIRKVTASRRRLLEVYFQKVVSPDDGTKLLGERSELLEALTAPNRSDLFIGGAVDAAAKVITLIRGDLDSVVVPFDWFKAGPASARPNFGDFEIIDSGQTVRLGEFEASADAVLYDHDQEYRRRAKKRTLELDDTFGAALRRLRLLRGLSREDFRDVSAKEVARIERGEVDPREATIKKLAKALQIRPDEIPTY